ncbi:hypothetical protein [uncultured Salinicola sp.]|uniref:hypothetical protein n=1 Tax=uncultured Salinicola sp. TaxID=1193542 RepID=UPI0026073D0F|nr:hypothetical protein [uncultured Salinicola sp.]|tara:strand:- start:718 stop:2667 length:1950 start_codon:yes stop_codon:yes gene_type:complete
MAKAKRERSLKNPWAIQGGQLVHISEVLQSEGKPTEPCLCPKEECSQPLILRRSRTGKNRSHFAHKNNDHHWTPEGLLHAVAKELIRNKMRVMLPALNNDPDNAGSRELESARWMHCESITEEAFIPTRWRADLLAKEARDIFDDEDSPFAIITEEETGSYLIIEIVVTSTITERKVNAYQKAGYRSMCIEFNRDDVSDPNLEKLILETAHRIWLSHPRWMKLRERQWREKEEARQQEIEAERRRVASILERIRSGRPPEWDPIDEKRLDAFARDMGLQDHLDIETPFDHWMAGHRKWWQTDLMRNLIREGMDQRWSTQRKPREHPCERVKGYIIPFNDDEQDETLLKEVKVSPGNFGKRNSATDFFIESLINRGVLTGSTRRPVVPRALLDIYERHKIIDNIIRPLFQGPGISTDISDHDIDEWKSRPHNEGARRDAIISGGASYDEIRQLAFRDSKAHYRAILDSHHNEHGKSSERYHGSVISSEPEPPLPVALESVVERPDSPSSSISSSDDTERSSATTSQREIKKIDRSTLGQYAGQSPRINPSHSSAESPPPRVRKVTTDPKRTTPRPPPPSFNSEIAERIYEESDFPSMEAKSKKILRDHSEILPIEHREDYLNEKIASLGGLSRLAHTKDRATLEQAISAR